MSDRRPSLGSAAALLGALLLASCGAPQNVPLPSGVTAPYDSVTNPFCGALGNCQAPSGRSYGMRGNLGGM
ncbi:MAG TPA: hypothetical protein VN802_04465 [Stellaceae bacterium]|nr:hypothetical protein [Stellaceae bacterium]